MSDKYTYAANVIIDVVIGEILEQNPEISVDNKEGNTLLYGDSYYMLEEKIAEYIKKVELK